MEFLRNRTVGQKIGFIVVILTALLVITSIHSVNKVSAIGHELQTIETEDMQLVKLVADITVKQLEKAILIEKAMRIAGVTNTSESVSELHQGISTLASEIDQELKQAEVILANAKNHALSDQHEEKHIQQLIDLEQSIFSIKKEHLVFEENVEHLMSRLESRSNVANQKVLAIEEAQSNLDHHLTQVLIDVESMTEDSIETVHQHDESALQGMILLSVASIIIGVLFGLLITRMITKPLAHAVEATKRLSKGDLTVQVEVCSKDETGQLLASMQTMTQTLVNMISQIAVATEKLTDATCKVTTITTQAAKNIESQNQDLVNTSSALNEMSATIQDVAQHASQTVNSTTQADNEATRGRKVVHQVNDSIHLLAADLEVTKAAISRLDHETGGVDDILEVITEIADQTNLLALNAAIEAARAGEQGRGFAVVADEVRMLANRTQQSISEIQQMTGRLKSEAKASVQSMENGHKKTLATVDLSKQAEQSLLEITQVVTAVNDMNMQIASAAEQQSVAAEQVNLSVHKVSDTAKENSVGAKQVKLAMEDMACLSENLKGLVGQFKMP